MFKNPTLRGRPTPMQLPEIKKPNAPNKAIKNPIAAALPIALLIEQPKNFKMGTFITAPPMPIGAEMKPDRKPKNIFELSFILSLIFTSFSLR